MSYLYDGNRASCSDLCFLIQHLGHFNSRRSADISPGLKSKPASLWSPTIPHCSAVLVLSFIHSTSAAHLSLPILGSMRFSRGTMSTGFLGDELRLTSCSGSIKHGGRRSRSDKPTGTSKCKTRRSVVSPRAHRVFNPSVRPAAPRAERGRIH